MVFYATRVLKATSGDPVTASIFRFPLAKARHDGATIGRDKKVRLTGNRCQCTACGQYYNSVSVFDRHRVGGWENYGCNRRCLTEIEMQARGWVKTRKGFWIERQRLDVMRRSVVHPSPCVRVRGDP